MAKAIRTTKPVKHVVSPKMRKTLSRVVAFDGGNGKASMHWLDEKGKLHRRTIPHAKTRVTGQRIKLDWGHTVTVDYADFNGQRFGYGDTIWDLAGEYSIDTFQNTPERYGTYDHISYALVLMAEMKLPDGEYDIMVSVPPGLYETVKEQVIQGFKAGIPFTTKHNGRQVEDYDGWWTLSISKDLTAGRDQPVHRYKFNRVIVLLEGWVGYAAYRFDLAGNEIELPGPDGNDLLAGVVRIGDAGFGTFDSPVLRDGSLVQDSLGQSTDDSGGIGSRLCEPILQKILDVVPEARLTLAHVDKYLRDFMDGKGGTVKPLSDDAATVDIRGKRLRLRGVFESAIKAYADWMWNSKITQAIRQNTDTYLADGGGWLYVVPFIQNWAEGKLIILTPDNVPHLKKYNYFELNGIGMLAVAAYNIRKYEAEPEGG